MAVAVREIRNPRTGQQLKFVVSRPDLLRIESLNPPSVEREPVHVHPRQTSGCEVRTCSSGRRRFAPKRERGPEAFSSNGSPDYAATLQ